MADNGSAYAKPPERRFGRSTEGAKLHTHLLCEPEGSERAAASGELRAADTFLITFIKNSLKVFDKVFSFEYK